MSRNFTSDTDTQREYFNATYFNNSGITQDAKYSTTLLKPFFNDPDKWKLAINRMRIPLSGIPLTKNNIPFEQWQVGIGYFNGAIPEQEIQLAYVPQLNPQSITENDYFNLSENFASQQVYIQPTFQVLNQSTIANASYTVLPASESSNGVKTFYIFEPDSTSVNVYQNNSNTLVWTFTLPTTDYLNISAICADLSGNFYIGYGTVDPTFGYNNLFVQAFTRTGVSTWVFGDLYSTTNTAISQTGVAWDTITVYTGNNALIGYCQVGVASPTDYFCQWSLGTTVSTNAGNTGQTNWLSISDSEYIYRWSTPNNLTVSNGVIFNYTYTNYTVSRFLGFDTNGYLLFYGFTQTDPTFRYYAIDAKSGTGDIKYIFTPTNGSYALIYNSTNTIIVDSGKADIFTYQTFLNQINMAFETAFNNIKTSLGNRFIPTQAPRITYNASTRLFSVVCEGTYSEIDPVSGNQEFQILFNESLWSQFYFPSYDLQYSGLTYKELIVQNNGTNAIYGNGSPTLPQFIVVQQEDSTIYAFYDLVRIIVGTNRIPVSGDGEGKTFSNTGFASNNSINMITDIVPDTTILTPGSVLIYVPAGILRWYNLYAQTPFDVVDLILSYETKDGTLYTVPVSNGEFFSVKLEFKKGLGDF